MRRCNGLSYTLNYVDEPPKLDDCVDADGTFPHPKKADFGAKFFLKLGAALCPRTKMHIMTPSVHMIVLYALDLMVSSG